MCALEQLLKILVSDSQADEETDGVLETVPGSRAGTCSHGGAKLGRSGDIGAWRLGYVLWVIEEPGAGRGGVCDGFLGCERLTDDDEQGALRIAEMEDGFR
jgi:hypothetical protein